MEFARMSQFPRATPTATLSDKDRVFYERIDRVKSKLLHTIELMVEQHAACVSAAPASGPAPAEVRRREMANALQVWRKCPQKTCRRTRACSGQPAHCLQACFPALPHDLLVAHAASTRRKRKR
jgi:hypothetical protein